MKIVAKIFNCNYETYKKFYKDAVAKAYKKDDIEIDPENIIIEVENLPGDTVQAQRSVEKHSRTISVLEDDKLKYIIGFSNTNYDEDKKKEVDTVGGKYVYGGDNYHSNTYLFQGLNKVFEYYYDEKNKGEKVKLFFYLLDTDQTYAKNLSNLMNYRKLATIGFEILNLDEISFQEYEQLGFSLEESHEDIKYISFNKFANDILYLSKRNIGNVPSYLKCIDENFDITKDEVNEDGVHIVPKQKYIYTFKTLSAEGYDSFFTMWTLIILAKQEDKDLEFLFGTQLYNLSDGEENYRQSTGFTRPILKLIEKAGLEIHYETSEEILHQFEREKSQYEKAKRNNILRNQELFKNNIRQKGIQTKCYLCGCEIEHILEAAHLWGVSEIKNAPVEVINEVISKPEMRDLIDCNNEHNQEQFYKRYVLANSGDNGVWLCSNHHGLFDSNYYCFDSSDGKILIQLDASDESKLFFDLITYNKKLPSEILTPKTKIFLSKRENLVKNDYKLEAFISNLR